MLQREAGYIDAANIIAVLSLLVFRAGSGWQSRPANFVASGITSTASEVDLRIAVNRKINQTNNKQTTPHPSHNTRAAALPRLACADAGPATGGSGVAGRGAKRRFDRRRRRSGFANYAKSSKGMVLSLGRPFTDPRRTLLFTLAYA